MYQFSPFSSVPAMTKLHTDEYEYTFTIEYLKPLNSLACERLESSIAQLM